MKGHPGPGAWGYAKMYITAPIPVLDPQIKTVEFTRENKDL